MSFLTDYFEISGDAQEQAVCCPFDHHTTSGIVYHETKPSAHVNSQDKLFHCKVCAVGYSEAQFIQKILGCSYADAKRLQRCFESDEDYLMWKESTLLTDATRSRALDLGISQEVIDELSIATPTGATNTIGFPVFMYDHLIDVRIYDPGNTPKIKSRLHAPAGLIIPFDIWRQTPSNRLTLICAGEKDMAIARSHGFNAITLTGGESILPKQISDFKDRQIAIVYDHDAPGINGAKKLATLLLEYTPTVKVVTGFHEICAEEKRRHNRLLHKIPQNKTRFNQLY